MAITPDTSIPASIVGTWRRGEEHETAVNIFLDDGGAFPINIRVHSSFGEKPSLSQLADWLVARLNQVTPQTAVPLIPELRAGGAVEFDKLAFRVLGIKNIETCPIPFGGSIITHAEPSRTRVYTITIVARELKTGERP